MVVGVGGVWGEGRERDEDEGNEEDEEEECHCTAVKASGSCRQSAESSARLPKQAQSHGQSRKRRSCRYRPPRNSAINKLNC